MRDVPDKGRRGAALVMAIVTILAIVMMLVGFLNQSLTYSHLAAEDTIKAKALEMAEMGLAMAYTRLKNGFPLDNVVEDYKENPPGRSWDKGEVDGTAKDGAHGNRLAASPRDEIEPPGDDARHGLRQPDRCGGVRAALAFA